MTFVVTSLVVVAILATFATLALGIGSMIYRGEDGPFDSEHWMAYRVILQVIALLALLATFVVRT
jgi:Hypoxia induced protein conserved region